MKLKIQKVNWREWDRIVGYRLKGELVGGMLTENGWAKQFIEGAAHIAVQNAIKQHNLIASATGKVLDGKFYDESIKQQINGLIKSLKCQRDTNDKLIENLSNLIK